MLSGAHDAEGLAAQACGLNRPQLRQLRSLVEERARCAWAVGDILVAAYGAPSPLRDGSYQRLQPLADELGVSVSWLTSCRACAAAWPLRLRRPSVCWVVHRRLAAFPDRVARLDRFVEHCHRRKITPSFAAVRIWLDSQRTEGTTPLLGRPRADPVDRLTRAALALDRDSLCRLVERLTAALTVAPAA